MREAHEHERRQIRRRMQVSRSRLSAAEVMHLSTVGCDRLLALPAFAAARHVVLYAAFDNELDTSMVVERALAEGKQVYLPSSESEDVPFRGVHTAPAEGFGRSGFLPPDGGPPLPPDARGVLFVVPGVAFDERGVRLGRGDGWYDRALARHPAGDRIGLAYDFQVVSRLPEAPWDVRMHAVVTDARLIAEVPPARGE